jgi:ATP-dependent helicase/nuclease subunit B
MGIRLVEASYGRGALDALTDAVAEAKTGDPMTLVTIIVPTNFAGIVARRHLATHLPPGGIEVTTLRRLAATRNPRTNPSTTTGRRSPPRPPSSC